MVHPGPPEVLAHLRPFSGLGKVPAISQAKTRLPPPRNLHGSVSGRDSAHVDRRCATLRAMDTALSSPPPSSTPILDRMTPLPPPEKPLDSQRMIGILLSLAVAGFIVLLKFGDSLGRWVMAELPRMIELNLSFGQVMLLGPSLILGSLFAIGIHEAAHLFVGVCLGFGFDSLQVGPLQFDRHLRISRYRGRSTMAAGRTAMYPVKTGGLAWRLIVMISAGPVANLCSGFAALFLHFSKGLFSYAFVIVSLFQGVLNLLPLDSGAELTDGRRILMLLRSRKCRERLVALAKLADETKAGVLPKNLSKDSLAKATAIKDNSPDTVQAHSIAYAAASSQPDDSKTAKYLETCLQYSSYAPTHIQQALMSAAGVFQARKRKRIDLAEQWLAAIPGKTEVPWMRANIEVAIREAKGDIEGALTQLVVIEKLVLELPDPVRREISHRSILSWKSELLAHVTATPQSEEQAAKA